MGQSILVVDDDEQIRSVVEASLKRAQFSVYACSSAKETLSLPLDQFDLMIFDVMMPDMDGFELCRNIREKVDCPILFLTAKSTEADVAEGLALGGEVHARK